MSDKSKYYSISNCEWLPRTGDARKMLIYYSISDDEDGLENKQNYSVVVKVARNVEKETHFENKSELADAIITYIQKKIESALIKNEKLPDEIKITTYTNDFPPQKDVSCSEIGVWTKVDINNTFGFI